MDLKNAKCFSGNIVRLPTGNTETAAHKIRELARGGLFQIEAVDAYPEDDTKTALIKGLATQGTRVSGAKKDIGIRLNKTSIL